LCFKFLIISRVVAVLPVPGIPEMYSEDPDPLLFNPVIK
jgi:hypothetical protein